MKSAPVVAAAIGVLVLVAGCGGKGGGNATNQAANGGGAAPTSGPDVNITIADLPRPKAGQWETTIDNGDGKPSVMKTCYSGKAPTMPKMPADCTNFTFKRTFLGAYVMDLSCNMHGMTITAHSVSTGDFQGNYTSDATMTMGGGALGPPHTMKTHTTATWVGPCAPGQTPDDTDDTNSAG